MPVRYLQHMEHALGDATPDPAIPAGLRIEPWSARNDEEFRMIRNESVDDRSASAPMPADSWQSSITNQTFRPAAGFLARDAMNGAPAGMLVTKCWEADTAATGLRDAHFILMRVLPDHRHRGVAGALVGHALRAAADQGYDRASVNVDSANPTGAFEVYEQAGFTSKRRFVSWAIEI